MSWKASPSRLSAYLKRKIQTRRKRREKKNHIKCQEKKEKRMRRENNKQVRENKIGFILHQLEKNDYPDRKIIEGMRTNIVAAKVRGIYRLHTNINRAVIARERRKCMSTVMGIFSKNPGRKIQKNVIY